MSRQTEAMDIDVENKEMKQEEKEAADKSDTERSVKDENKLESRSEDGGQSIRVIFWICNQFKNLFFLF